MDKLKRVIEKKFKTTYIGSVYAIEKAFNVIWDKNAQQYIPGPPLTENDGEFTGILTPELLRLFTEIRDEILDLGNSQCRNLKNELDEYFEIKPKTYHTEFRIATGE